MPLAGIKEVLTRARQGRYGVLSLLGGNLDMTIGQIRAAEDQRAPLILAFNQEVTPQVPMELAMPMLVNAAQRATVPVVTILDHGHDLESVARAIYLGTSSVMFDGSMLDYEENVRQTREVVRLAHAVGVSVEAELGSIGGSAVESRPDAASGDDGGRLPESIFTDLDVAAEFCEATGVDALAISFGNAHGIYEGEPKLDLDLVRAVHARVGIPLVMHGASGLADSQYPEIVASGISKVCYYTAAGIRAGNHLREMLMASGQNGTVYHQIVARTIDFFCQDTKRLMDLVGCTGKA